MRTMLTTIRRTNRLNLRELSMNREEWISKIDRRRRALALVLADGEKERNFFQCNYYGLLTTAAVLSSAQFTMWGYMSFSIVTAVEKSPLQAALSLSAFAFSGVAMILISPASRSLVSEMSLLPNRKLRIKSHFPERFGGTCEIPVDEMQIREVPDSRFSRLERVDANQRFLMDVAGGRFVGTDMDAVRTLLRRRVLETAPPSTLVQDHSTTTNAASVHIDAPSNVVAVTRERRLKQYHNNRGRLGKLWRKRR